MPVVILDDQGNRVSASDLRLIPFVGEPQNARPDRYVRFRQTYMPPIRRPDHK